MSNYRAVLFRADASSTIGTGHIMRDLILAKQYPDSKIYFATRALDGNLNNKIRQEEYEVVNLQTNDIEELDKVVKKLGIDLLIIDHYEIHYEDEKKLSILNSQLSIMVLDDTYEKHHCDMLLNHNISADASRYKDLVPKDCELRCGEKYTLLREEFKAEKKIQREKIYDIFIAMGGADTAGLNVKILEILGDAKNIVIVTTTANRNLDTLKKYVQNKNNISLFINSIEVAKLINQSKLAIITPSVTVNEVLFLDVPFIAIKTADNQEDIYNYLKRNRYKILSTFSVKVLTNLLSRELVNFTELSLDEKKMILQWRNDERIKKWMFSTDTITLENHLKYIDMLSLKKDRVYFLVKYKNSPIGVIDFTEIDAFKANFGLYANPDKKGVGNILMEEIINYGFHILKVKKLIAEVFETNIKAIKLYGKYDFTTVEKKDNLLIMELDNENR